MNKTIAKCCVQCDMTLRMNANEAESLQWALGKLQTLLNNRIFNIPKSASTIWQAMERLRHALATVIPAADAEADLIASGKLYTSHVRVTTKEHDGR